MKKVIVAICISLAIVALAGCGTKNDAPTKEEPKVETKTEDVTQYGELMWPDIGLATLLPKPDWSGNGEVKSNYENYICIRVGYSTEKDLKNYTKRCYDAGFNVNYTQGETKYIAFDEAGNELILKMMEGSEMSIQIYGAPEK